jgi:dienelactone hydrolase
MATYLALRRRDLRSLQLALMPLGLSSLGRCEPRVLENLDAVLQALAAITDNRTLPGRAARLERALSELGIAHDVKEYPGAGHSFLNRINAGRILSFFDEHLRAAAD